jgi:hypothetical protein
MQSMLPRGVSALCARFGCQGTSLQQDIAVHQMLPPLKPATPSLLGQLSSLITVVIIDYNCHVSTQCLICYLTMDHATLERPR